VALAAGEPMQGDAIAAIRAAQAGGIIFVPAVGKLCLGHIAPRAT
jgi:hypothetical protein